MTAESPTQDPLSQETPTWIYDLLERFEQAWEEGRRPAIEDFLPRLEGLPRTVVTDDSQYRQQVIDPAWNALPAPFRLRGRGPHRTRQPATSVAPFQLTSSFSRSPWSDTAKTDGRVRGRPVHRERPTLKLCTSFPRVASNR